MRTILIASLMTLATQVGALEGIRDGEVYSCTATTHSSIEPDNKINWKQPTLVFNVQINGNNLKFDEGSYFEPPEVEEWVINRGGVGKGVLTASIFPLTFALNKKFEEFAFTSPSSFLVLVIMGTCKVSNQISEHSQRYQSFILEAHPNAAQHLWLFPVV